MENVYFTPQSTKTATPLFNLEPRGMGTDQVQSLFDYLKTLAVAHRLSLQSIIDLLMGLLGRKPGDVQPRMNKGCRSHGITASARLLLEAATIATGRTDLAMTTMLPFAGRLSSNFLTAPPRFCPICFLKTPEGQLPHTRLLWCLQPVQCCPIHKVKLMLPVCGAKAKYGYPRVITEGVCSYCGAIGHSCNKAKPERVSETDVWVANQVADLLARANEVEQSCPQAPKSFLRAYCERPGLSVAKVARRSGLSISLYNYLRDVARTMELNAFLKIAASEGLSLVGLLKGTAEPCPPPTKVVPKLHRVVKRDRDWTAIGATADGALRSGQSLGAWARQLGIHPSSLVKRLPEQCAQLAKATAERRSTAHRELMKRHILECEKIADSRWADKRCVTPLRKHDGKRLNGERPHYLRALGVLLTGGDISGKWGLEVEQALREAAARIAFRHGTDTPC